ncbi:MAG: hypothetical protein AABX05_02040 [Nanoarchaeota archaeon]
MDKRGQIVIFIIIGMLLLAGALVFFQYKYALSKPSGEKAVEGTGKQSAIVSSLVESCLIKTLNQGILENSRNGGYFLLPSSSTTELNENVAYYSVNGKDTFPQDRILAEELGKYVDSLLFICLNDFQSLKKQGYLITAQEPSSLVTLTPEKVLIATKMPINMKISGTEKSVNDFAAEISSVSFNKDMQLAREVAKTQQGKEICVSCFSSKAAENEVVIVVLPVYNNTYVYELEDQNYLIGEENYKLRFAVRYEAEN